jgi:hypothetical protein
MTWQAASVRVMFREIRKRVEAATRATRRIGVAYLTTLARSAVDGAFLEIPSGTACACASLRPSRSSCQTRLVLVDPTGLWGDVEFVSPHDLCGRINTTLCVNPKSRGLMATVLAPCVQECDIRSDCLGRVNTSFAVTRANAKRSLNRGSAKLT